MPFLIGVPARHYRPGDAPGMIRSMAKTQGQLEAQISEFLTRFEREYMGRGPLEVRTFLVEDMVIVRLRGVLTPAEQQLVKAQDDNHRGRDLIKQVRLELVNRARPMLAAGIKDILRIPVVSMHADISTKTGEKVIIFSLAERLAFPANG